MNGWALNVIINAKHSAQCLAPNEHPIVASYCCLIVIAIVDVDEVSRMVGVWHIANIN